MNPKYLLISLVFAATNAYPEITPQFGVSSLPISTLENITPYVIPPADGEERGGNRTCADVGKAYFGNPLYYQCYTDKKDYPFSNIPETFESSSGLPVECANTINVEVIENTYVNWTATNSIGAVIVKGGNNANTYVYDPQVNTDTGLASPINASSNPANLSNIGGFCWNPSFNNECFDDETAWAANSSSKSGTLKYINRGNWATYVAYQPNKVVTLFAGQTIPVGNVTFIPEISTVKIVIELSGDWIFGINYELDINGNIVIDDMGYPIRDDNVKVQDYDIAPSGNPAPGLFAWKSVGINQYAEITVPVNNFYGIHVDVALPVECTN